MENENIASISGSTHTGDRGPYRTGHVLVNGVGVVGIPELIRQYEAEKQQSRSRAEYILLQKKTIDDLRRTLVAIDSGWTPSPNVPPQVAEFVQAALEELAHAKAKHGEKCIDGPGYTEHQRLAIVMEELGEVAHELTYDSQPEGVEGGAVGRLLGEMVQVAAMVLGWGATLMPGQAAEMPAAATEPDPCPQAPTEDAASLWDRPGRVVLAVPKGRLHEVLEMLDPRA